MKQLLLALDDSTARRLEKVAPARSHRRSEFIRGAIRKALDALAEQDMDDAYRRIPEEPGDEFFDPAAWGPWRPEPAKPRRAAKAVPRQRAARGKRR
jgi:hypothetical protein